VIGEQLSVCVACLASVLVLGTPAADAQHVEDERESGRSEASAAGEPQPDEQSTVATPSKRKRSAKSNVLEQVIMVLP
jgi:hypothetical protein